MSNSSFGNFRCQWNFFNFGSWQNLPILAIDDICQFWQLTVFGKFGNWQYLANLATYNFQFWQLTIFANFGNWWYLPCLPNLATDNILQFWQLTIVANFAIICANFSNWRYLPILVVDDICKDLVSCNLCFGNIQIDKLKINMWI